MGGRPPRLKRIAKDRRSVVGVLLPAAARMRRAGLIPRIPCLYVIVDRRGSGSPSALGVGRCERKGRFMQIRTPLAATAFALGMTFGGAALAQEAPAPEAAPAEAPAAATNFSQEKLDAFVAAALEVSGIQQEAAAQLMTAEDQAGQDEVLQQANDRMVEAIE